MNTQRIICQETDKRYIFLAPDGQYLPAIDVPAKWRMQTAKLNSLAKWETTDHPQTAESLLYKYVAFGISIEHDGKIISGEDILACFKVQAVEFQTSVVV